MELMLWVMVPHILCKFYHKVWIFPYSQAQQTTLSASITALITWRPFFSSWHASNMKLCNAFTAYINYTCRGYEKLVAWIRIWKCRLRTPKMRSTTLHSIAWRTVKSSSFVNSLFNVSKEPRSRERSLIFTAPVCYISNNTSRHKMVSKPLAIGHILHLLNSVFLSVQKILYYMHSS